MLLAYLHGVAQLSGADIYFNPFKLLGILALFVLWAMVAQWVDKDTLAVNTYRLAWNMVLVACGAVGLALALFVPNFLIGLPAQALLLVVGGVVYVVHRNGLVAPEQTVLTASHFRRIREQGLKGKPQVKEVKERVRVTGANHQVVMIPEDEVEREQYRIMQDLLFDTFWRRAALTDIAPAGQSTKITYLIDGVPTEREGLPRQEGDAVVLYLKRIAGLSLEERRKPQRGKITVALGDSKHTVVLLSAGTTAGERLRLRVVGPEGSSKVKDLGFADLQLQNVRPVMGLPRGLVLLTGPKSNGVTTTVYSFVRTHDAFLQNIQLLEYDREIDIENVTQHLFLPKDDNSFPAELQKIVRSDPDILVLPEIRDKETALLATKAAAEKAKVYVGFNAEDVFDALRKWTALVGDKTLVAKALAMITNQRLVRVLCSECKERYRPDATMLRKLNMPTDAMLHRPPQATYDKRGNLIVCQACQGTGYVGRTGVFETLIVDDELRRVIRAAGSIAEVKSFALKLGVGLQTPAVAKVLGGLSSIQEIVRVIRGQSARPLGGSGGASPGPPPGGGPPSPRPRPAPPRPAGKTPR
jgi:type II secretory ATPase GspE/PulE/Tfp pilus assembly ATPase PilB-like protein